MVNAESYGDGNSFKVHTDKCSADVKTCVSLDFFKCNGIFECFVCCCGKRTACLWLWNNIHDFSVRNSLSLNDDCTIEVFTALCGKVNLSFAKHFVYTLENSLSGFKT